MPIKIRIALSNHLFCEGIRQLLAEAGCDAVFHDEAAGATEFAPDIVLFDSGQSIRALTAQHPAARFVLLDTGLNELDLTCLLLCHHVSGIITPDADRDNLCKALHTIYNGEIWIEQKHLKILLNKGRALPDSEGLRTLSAQDNRIVELIAQGSKNREIANQLCLSEATIKAHVSKLFRLLNVKNRAQLASLVQSDPGREL